MPRSCTNRLENGIASLAATRETIHISCCSTCMYYLSHPIVILHVRRSVCAFSNLMKSWLIMSCINSRRPIDIIVSNKYIPTLFLSFGRSETPQSDAHQLWLSCYQLRQILVEVSHLCHCHLLFQCIHTMNAAKRPGKEYHTVFTQVAQLHHSSPDLINSLSDFIRRSLPQVYLNSL